MKLRGWAAIGCVGASAFGVVLVQRERSSDDGTSARTRAMALFEQGLERELQLDYSGAVQLFRTALTVDPSYFAPAVELIGVFSGPVPSFLIAFFDSLGAHLGDHALRACLNDIITVLAGRGTPQMEPAASPSPAARDCDTFRHVLQRKATEPISPALRELLAKYEYVPAIAERRLSVLKDAVGSEVALARSRVQSGPSQHPRIRAAALAIEAHWLHLLGRHGEALQAERRAREDRAWRRPGFRSAFLNRTITHASLLGQTDQSASDSLAAHVANVVEESVSGAIAASVGSHDAFATVVETAPIALWLSDRGRLLEARSLWTQIALASDRTGDPNVRTFAHTRFGRTLVKLGQLADAERELLIARQAGLHSATPFLQKEAEHNLLHLYESLGRFDEAKHAGTEFVRYARMGGLHPVRMMSERDLARLLRAQGEVEASRPHFERMLADIDSLNSEWNYAAEYYELIGELDQARRYYERSLNVSGEVTRPLEGLVRIAQATGDTAGAFRFAKLHDERREALGIPESAPMLPGALAKAGRVAQAKDALARTRQKLSGRGQTAAHAAVSLELAELELKQGNAANAQILAREAEAGARSVASTQVALRAVGVAAVAAARLGASRAEALAVSNRTRREADQIGYPELRAEMRLLGAQALVASGDWRVALERLVEAAAITDSVAERIALDPVRAGYRAAQRRIYEAAFETIITRPKGAEAVRLFVEWSTRRKKSGLAHTTRRDHIRLPSVESGAALIDYVVTGPRVLALVITNKGTHLEQLQIDADSVQSAIQRLYGALDIRVGSAIDVGRARFRLDIAHQLYRALLQPLMPNLREVTNITVVPDGSLHLVPFDALVIEPPRSTTDESSAVFVLDRYAVSRATSLETGDRQWRLRDGAVIAFAPSASGELVPESEQEIAALVRALPAGRVRVLANTDATERALRVQTTGASVLHFATHAVSNDEDPSYSRLVLAAGDDDDGRLHVFELASHRFDGALVFLNACETASGRVLDGAGLLSLSRGFLNAGAEATVATLWPVGPNTGDFTEAFYQALSRERSPVAALHASKRSLRARGLGPFFWAPYAVFTGS